MNRELIQKSLHFALFAASLWFALAFIYVAVFSISYSFGMEWLEGHVMEMIARSAENKPIYVAPSLDYVPFIYTPFYYHIAAIFTEVMGVDFAAGRTLSILSTLGIAGVIASWVRLLGNSRLDAFIAAGMYFAAYNIMGRWYDLVRVDNFYVLLLISGLYVLQWQRGISGALIAAGLFALAFYTKQSAIFAFLPVMIWTIMTRRNDGLIAAVFTSLAIVMLVVVSDAVSGEWFSFYVFNVPAGHGLDDQYILGFFSGDLIKNWWPMLVVTTALAIYYWRNTREQFWNMFALGLGLVGSSYIARIHWGGYVNVLIPMTVFFALVGGQGIKHWWPATLLLLVQFALLYYHPNDLLPNDSLLENNQKAIETMAKLEGDIFIPELHFIHWPKEKKAYVYGMAAFDIFRSENAAVTPVKEKMKHELEEAFSKHRFDGAMPGALLKLREADPYYTKSERLWPVFRYQTGLVRQQNPILLQLPK